jgi:hypothetical protein
MGYSADNCHVNVDPMKVDQPELEGARHNETLMQYCRSLRAEERRAARDAARSQAGQQGRVPIDITDREPPYPIGLYTDHERGVGATLDEEVRFVTLPGSKAVIQGYEQAVDADGKVIEQMPTNLLNLDLGDKGLISVKMNRADEALRARLARKMEKVHGKVKMRAMTTVQVTLPDGKEVHTYVQEVTPQEESAAEAEDQAAKK